MCDSSGHGIEAALAMKMPYGELRLEAISAVDGGGACAPGDSFDTAVKVSSSWGVEVSLHAGLIGEPQKGVDVTLAVSLASFPFFSTPAHPLVFFSTLQHWCRWLLNHD